MKKMYILLLAIMLVMILFLAGCSYTPAVKSGQQIMSDLASARYFSETYPEFIIKDIEVVKRQTDVENKSDKVYVTLSVINGDESISGYIDMVVLYELYNDGWILENCEMDFDGANAGSYFRPEKELDLSLDEISSDLNLATGEIISDIAIYGVEADLENGTVSYSMTGTEYHTYMTGEIDATLTYQFIDSSGYWAPFLTVNSYEEYWDMATRFDNPHASDVGVREDNLVLGVFGSIDTLSVAYISSEDGFGESESDLVIYKVDSTPLEQAMGDFFEAVHKDEAEYITKYGFPIRLTEDCTDYYSFEYVVWWDGGGNRFDGMLFVGKDQIGYMHRRNYEIDVYNRRVVCEVYELLPIKYYSGGTVGELLPIE